MSTLSEPSVLLEIPRFAGTLLLVRVLQMPAFPHAAEFFFLS